MRRALCPGSFDPVTVGHMDIIRRAADLFDEVIVLVAANSAKQPMFTAQQRADMLNACFAQLPGVRAEVSEELVADAARRLGACALVKGVRSVADFEYEQTLDQVNRFVLPGLETVILYAQPSCGWISSTVVREMLRYGQDVSALMPAPALEVLKTVNNQHSEKGCI